MRFSVITAAIFGSTIAFAHMEISNPAPFRSKKNPHANQNTVDYSMTSPLDASGGKLCKGYEVDFADAAGVGAATGTYPQGSQQAVTMMGSARHDGGSCQISLSTDSGKTFTVLQSVQGGCPGGDGSTIPFTVPSDAPVGRAILSWSWMAHTGGRPEMYHLCSAVEITAGSGAAPAVAFSARPAMFVANIGTGCSTVGGKNAKYPNPGPDVVGTGDEDSTTGNCGTAAPATGGAPAPAPEAGSPPASSVSPEAPASSANPGIPVASSSASGSAPANTLATSTLPASSATGPISTGTPSTDLKVSTDGTCGSDKKCPESTCCSSSGYCGSSTAHCGTGCQPGFGICSGGNSTIKIRGLSGRIRRN